MPWLLPMPWPPMLQCGTSTCCSACAMTNAFKPEDITFTSADALLESITDIVKVVCLVYILQDITWRYITLYDTSGRHLAPAPCNSPMQAEPWVSWHSCLKEAPTEHPLQSIMALCSSLQAAGCLMLSHCSFQLGMLSHAAKVWSDVGGLVHQAWAHCANMAWHHQVNFLCE